MTRRGDAGEEQAFKAVQVSSGYNRLGNMVAYRCYLLQPFRPAYLCRHDKQHVLGIVMWRCCKIFTHGLPVPHFHSLACMPIHTITSSDSAEASALKTGWAISTERRTRSCRAYSIRWQQVFDLKVLSLVTWWRYPGQHIHPPSD